MHPLTTMSALDRAAQYLDVLVWAAPDSDMGWQVLTGDPETLLGLTLGELEHYAADADWPGLRYQDTNLRQQLLLNARVQGEACSQYALARGDRLEWLEERVVYRDKGWHGLIRRLPFSPEQSAPERDRSELDTAKRSAANAHRRLRHLLETSPAVLYACDSKPPWTLNYISRNLSQLLGLNTDAERINLRERVHPDDEARLLAWLEDFAYHRRKRRALRYRLRHVDGHYLTVQNEARVTRPVREGAAPELVGTLLDVSREAELLARLEIMTDRIPGLIFQFHRTPGGRLSFPYVAGNDDLLEGLDPQELALDAGPALERVHEEDLTPLMIAIERSVQRHAPLATQIRLRQPDGNLRWAAARAQPETCGDGGTLWHGVLLDITDQVAHEAHLRELSDTDDLTGLANRRRLMQRLDEEMSRARRHGSVLTLLLLDLDYFKRINDTLGHLKGDQVLREIAMLCRETLRHEDVVARFGGEELAILLPLTPLVDGLHLAERLRQNIADHDYGISQNSVTASLGVAEYIDGDTTDTLIERADRGLYAAKHDGRNRVVSIQ